MKRFYLANAFFALPLFLLLAFFKQQGFFMANIMRQDIIYYIAVISTFTLFGVITFGYQFFKIDWKNKRALLYQIPSLITTVYILTVLACINQIYITAGMGLIIVLISIPAALILFSMAQVILNKEKVSSSQK